GFLGPDLTAAHCVWITINEVRTLARHGVSVAHCPVSNMKLASGGVAPVPEMLREGIVVGLGTDSPISNNAMDMFADMKIAALLHKAARWDARAMPAQVVLDLATVGGARALHMEREIGSVEVGKRADLAVVSLRGAHTTPFYPENVISHLVYGCPESEKVSRYEVVVIPAERIDIMRSEMSLNDFEAKLFAEVIDKLRPETAYVDAADVDEIEFKRCVRKELAFDVEIVSQHNADEL